jgi:DNA-binding NarL/FixJ family response regulator
MELPMIAINNERNETNWQSAFVAMMPEIEQKLRLAFCRLDPEAREDAMEEGVVHSLLAYIRLVEQGRAEVATASSLAWYSSRHVKRGRPAGGRMNCKEPLSRYGQISNNIEIERQSGNWIDTLVEDSRAAVPDQVAAKMDVGAWFATLTKRMKEIAKDLAFGCSTSEVAAKHGVSAGRISQLRRTLEESWATFQQEAAPAMA